MKRKVLGIMLFLSILTIFLGCQTTTTTTQATNQEVVLEFYSAGNVLLKSNTVPFTDEATLLDLLQAHFVVYCQGEDGNPDDTCSYETQYGYYVMGIDTLTAFNSGEYIALYINGEYAITGIGDTPLVAGNVYQFKLESF